MGFGKKPTNDTLAAATSGMVASDSFRSFHDIFASENSERAKQMIMSGVRHELHRSTSRAASESSTEDYVINRIDPVDMTAKPTMVKIPKNARKSTMLLAGPKFRFHTVESEVQLKRDTIYPISVSIKLSLCPIDATFSLSLFISALSAFSPCWSLYGGRSRRSSVASS